MNLLILSKTFLIGTYQRQLEHLAREVNLTVVVPPYWRELGVGRVPLERSHLRGYRLLVRPIALNGRFHLYFWPGLRRLLEQERPDVLHIDEESFNLATFQAMRLSMHIGSKALFFNWANLHRRLPPPFSWFERYTLSHAHYAVAGNHEAAQILRKKGYQGPLQVIPQVGVDTERFSPPTSPRPQGPLRIGYVGRLVPQKGVLDLLEAFAGLLGNPLLFLVGSGQLEPTLRRRARELGVADRVTLTGRVPSLTLPDLYHRLDLLVLPSRTRPNWKEQFGRVLIEAMACGVPVVGSDSGEIPHVVGKAGLLFPEGDTQALRERLERLQDPALRKVLSEEGRRRVLMQYSQARIAQNYLAVYRQMLGQETR